MIKIIVNPQADKGKSGFRWKEIETRLIKNLNIEYESVLTESPKHATYLTRKTQQEGVKLIFLVGGDGTVSEAINGIYLEDIVLGIIPTGSGNDFAKMLGIRTVLDGLSSFNTSFEKVVDVGCLNKDKYFINNLGIGLDAYVVKLQRRERFRNEISYLFSTLKILSSFSEFPVKVNAPDFKFSGNVLSISVGNGQYHGGLFRLTPQAKIDDGLLDICIIKQTNKLKRFLNVPKAIKGSHISLKEVESFKTKKISISSPLPLQLHLDGELYEPLKELEIEVLPRKLTFRALKLCFTKS